MKKNIRQLAEMNHDRSLIESEHWPDQMGGWYDIARDGQRFITVRREGPRRTKLVVVLNWFEEIKRKAPTGK